MVDRAGLDSAEAAAGDERPGELLSPWLWLRLPLLLLPALFVVRAVDPGFYTRYVEPENGLIELPTAILALVAVGFGVAAWRWRRQLPRHWLWLWLAMMTAGGFYFAGEEVSWGQQLVGWDTPPEIAALNDQHETNLHNMSSWLDQKPRFLLEMYVVLGGILAPLWRHWRRPDWRLRRDWQAWFWPPDVCLPAALMAAVTGVLQRLHKWTGVEPPHPFDLRYSEVVEIYFALFLICYLAATYYRLRRLAAAVRVSQRS